MQHTLAYWRDVALVLIVAGGLATACGDLGARTGSSATPPSGSSEPTPGAASKADSFWSDGDSESRLGAVVRPEEDRIAFRVRSANATRIEVWLYREPFGAEAATHYVLEQEEDGPVFSTAVSLSELRGAIGDGTIYYGYRAWGPNWRYDDSWEPGTEVGFESDVDAEGNRFNPNKLLLDPYALEISHDPRHERHRDATVYASGPQHRDVNSGPYAPKGIAMPLPDGSVGPRPTRPFRNDIVYEVHVRGLTQNDPSVPERWRGTYRGAAEKAAYLRRLGVTAIELLPVQETQNDTNDIDPQSTDGDNYWGYATLNYFAPDRRYAADQSPGGPTREFREMVEAFHNEGIKVYIDVVYNHTGEGGLWNDTGKVASLLSWRGLDNASYYQVVDGTYYYDNNGVGPNFNVADPAVRNQIIDSLRYWHEILGVDGFRFDLASILGNECEEACFEYDKLNPNNVLNRAADALPARPAGGGEGVELIAEPWAIGAGTQQAGNFPHGWAEWNDAYRNTIRKDQNRLGVTSVTPGDLATRIAGSSDMFEDDGRKPWHSVNFLVAHDGLTLNDLYSCNGKNNNQEWPYGPSDGGSDHNIAWDHEGDPARQRKAARTGMALLMVSAGVPMMTGGDEMLRTIRCNNNSYNLDSPATWLDWSRVDAYEQFHTFTERLLQFRQKHPALRPRNFYDGEDHDGDGLADITWLRDDGHRAGASYMENPQKHFLAWRLDADEFGEDAAESIYVAYNGWSGRVTAQLPETSDGYTWYRVSDTATWMEPQANFRTDRPGTRLDAGEYELAPRSVVIAVERTR